MMKTITTDALVRRINRKLKADGKILRKCRAKNMRAYLDFGDFYLLSVYSNGLLRRAVDVDALGRELGVLKCDEAVAGSH
jgi:hypothetical protein